MHFDAAAGTSVIRAVSGGNCLIASFNCFRAFFPNGSLASVPAHPYLLSVDWIRFFNRVRWRVMTIRARVISLWSRSSRGGIQTVDKVSLRCSRFSPWTSSLSVLLIIPIISLALRGWTSRVSKPASSISSTIQYQLPVASTATGGEIAGRSLVYYLATDSLAAVALPCLAKPDWICRVACTPSS